MNHNAAATITGISAPASPDGKVSNGDPLQFADPEGLGKGNTCIFIFATEDRTISCWAPGNLANFILIERAQLIIDNTNTDMTINPVYKGLATGSNSHGAFIYATDFRNRTVVAWNSSFAPDSGLGAAFDDPAIPEHLRTVRHSEHQ